MAEKRKREHTAASRYPAIPTTQEIIMAKKSRGGRMTAAKARAAKSKGGKGPVKSRPAGRKIMKT